MEDKQASAGLSRRQLQLRKVHTRFTVVKRIVHVFVISGALALAVALILSLNEYQTQWHRMHLHQPGATLSQQYAQLLRPATTARDISELATLLAVLKLEPAVLSVTVYDQDGRKLASTDGAQPLVSESMLRASPVTYLKRIRSQSGQEVGYVQLLFDRELVLSEPATLNQQLYKLIAAGVLLAMLFATYFTRGIYKSRRWLVRRLYS
ncbi:hypothetical protein [Alteromonas halophila]|uniref:Smp protein n=1 Tax=Alteromonas halophila TaxID=516698 RepID=A0A918JLS2_9ALTE|nr:hypothetical protein [Alteromonas halophila]GGW85942.1 hypothetical protein GCM10007391_19450 [Alteromonas halophila]